jgi:ATP-dependent DNA helicase RecQ
MQKQVKRLNNAGIHAGYINAALNEIQIAKALERAALGTYKIVYLDAAKLDRQDVLDFVTRCDISMVVVDEAHRISRKEREFLGAYPEIPNFINRLSHRPILCAFTDRAPKEVNEEIISGLGLQNPTTVVSGFDRENIYHRVEGAAREKFITQYLREHPDECGIIACHSSSYANKLYSALSKNGFTYKDISKNPNDFFTGKTKVLITANLPDSTMEKDDIRYIIHYNIPIGLHEYYRRCCLAGRDGKRAESILLAVHDNGPLFNSVLKYDTHTDVAAENREAVMEREKTRLCDMRDYGYTTECLRSFILSHYGQKQVGPCGNCGNCNRTFSEKNMTAAAKEVIHCIKETDSRYGSKVILSILLGEDNERLQKINARNYQSFGKLKGTPENALVLLLTKMRLLGYLYEEESPYKTLRIGDISALKEGAQVIVKFRDEKSTRSMLMPYADLAPDKQQAVLAELRAGYSYQDDLTCNVFARQLTDIVAPKFDCKIPGATIRDWLTETGMTERRFCPEDNKDSIMPTEKGLQIGLSTKKLIGERGKAYTAVIYGKETQEFLMQNLAEILASH